MIWKSLEFQTRAVYRHSKNIQHIENPSEELQLYAVNDDYFNLRFINDPCEAAQLVAVRANSSMVKFIKNPTLQVVVMLNTYKIGHYEF